jgi:2-amino-4-hydroxy-6-hydroxymethyldihydropteridine diphosphokinase
MIAMALRELQTPQLRLLRASRSYETEPIGLKDQPWFLNLAAEFETELEPLEVLENAKRAERLLGRVRTVPNGPRTIDIDILLFGNCTMKSGDLEIPHPRYRERRFTLAPLAELTPNQRDPITGRTMSEMLSALKGQSVKPTESELGQS